MKANKIYFAIIVLAILAIASCQKLTNNSPADPDAKQHNEDISNTKNESDNLNTDINNLLRELNGFGKREGVQASVCGATIDSSLQHSATPTVILHFDGTTTCGNPARIRSGEVKIELVQGARWSDAGAKLKITHTNYKVTFVNLNNHFVTFNGVKYLTNVTGLNWVDYYFTGSLTAQLRERSYDLTVTFENGQTSSWNSARLSTWEVTNHYTITATVNGDTTINGKTIDSWGVTRFGTNFTTEMITPWKSGTQCGWWRPTQGKYTSTTDDFTITATFGVGRNGSPASGCSAYGTKLEWDYNSGTSSGEAVIAYF